MTPWRMRPTLGRMRTRLQTLLPSVLALTFVSLLVAPLVAVAQSPAISMYPEGARPGSTVELVGIGFPAEQVVEVQLKTPDGTMALATTATDFEGTFAKMVALPFSPSEGVWELQATAADGTTSTYGFAAAVASRTAAEPAAEPVAQPAAEPAPVAAPSGNSSGDIALMLIIAVVLGGVAFGAMVIYRQSKDESPPGMGRGDDLIWGGGSAEAPQQTATEEPHWKDASPTQAEPSES